MSNIVVKKCRNCGATVEILKDCECDNCGIHCCGEPMAELIPNTSDGAVEKHKPEVKINGELIEVSVNHVMEPEHYIEALIMVTGAHQIKKSLTPENEPKAIFPYVPGSVVYALCNKHGLWETEIN